MSIGFIKIASDSSKVKFQSLMGTVPGGTIGIGLGKDGVVIGVNNEILKDNECVIFAVKGNTKTLKSRYQEKEDLLFLQKQTDQTTSYIRYKKLYLRQDFLNISREGAKTMVSVRTAASAIRSFFGSSHFNKFVTSNSSYMFWCISRIAVENSSYYSAIYCDDIAQLKRINKLSNLEGSDVSNITIGSSFVSTNSSSKNCLECAGFFINAGYYKINADGYTTSVIDEPGNYIGVNDNNVGDYKEIKCSNVVSDSSSLSQYNSIYELSSNEGPEADDAIHYRKYNQSSGGGISGVGSIDINWPDFEIPGIDLDYGRNAMSISKNFIDDFSGWKLNFVPAKGIEYDKDKIKNLELNIKDNNFNGIKNSDILEPKIKLNTTEINLEELCDILDNAIKKSTEKVSSGNVDIREILPIIVKIKNKNTNKFLTNAPLSSYFNFNLDDRKDYEFVYYVYKDGKYSESSDSNITFESFIDQISNALINVSDCSINVQLSLNQERKSINLYSLELFEAYTRGHDFIQENYTTVRPEERDPDNINDETSRAMSFTDNYFTYKYTGRDIDILMGSKDNATILEMSDTNKIYCGLIHSCDLLQESDVTLGETYGEQQYFIEAIKAPEWNNDNDDIKKESGKYLYKDSFKVKDFLDIDNGGFNPTLYSDEDIEVVTSNIDLLQCEYYKPLEANYSNDWCDCAARVTEDGKPAVECIYQKLGYCPYRFETEKHPRRIRTLQQSKSNRFNLIQELCKVFEFYPYFYIEHDDNGKILLDDDGRMKKHIFFMTEKGNVNQLGFRYEKNLSSISRTLDSSSITTKLYVESVDSQYTDDGLCSIQTATDNIGRTSYILDFSYYAKIGNLSKEQLQRDIYGIDSGDFAFLQRIGEYNKKYDNYSNLIITMTGEKLTELEAQIKVSTEGISTALEERKKVGQTMYQFKTAKLENNSIYDTNQETSYVTSDTYKNYILKYREQATILWGLVEQLFFSGDYFSIPVKKQIGKNIVYDFYVQDYTKNSVIDDEKFSKAFNNNKNKYCKGELFWRLMMEGFEDDDKYEPPFNYWSDFKEKIVDTKLYEINGKIGEYKSLYNEVQYWKRERAKILNKINDLSTQFYQKYEPYIKEGTFSDSNYLTDNEYYWAGVQVLEDSCEPQLSYTINVIDISPLPEYSDDYNFELSDTTFIEDIDFFGINKKTGLPNREKVIVSEIEYDLDVPSNNSIKVQNYSSKFEDLFSSITASVQSLTFNENVYKRASNFTAKQYVTTDSLQSTLDIGDLTLLDTPKENITLDESGTEGNDINNTASQYKITGEGVYFSKDGGETWDYGVGPGGINMDYAKFGSLDASKVQIVDGEYIYFLWDKDGINAYRDPSTSTEGLVDFARFNKYGLSLIENNNVRLRAGYEFITNSEGNNNTGNYNNELPLTNQNVGFYLYNDSGQPIFKTETRSNYSEDEDSDYTARLSLTGEMFVTNKILDSSAGGSNGESFANTLELKKRYIFIPSSSQTYSANAYTPILKSLITDNKSYSFVETEINSVSGQLVTDVNLFNSITLDIESYLDADGNKYYEYSTDKTYYIYEISYSGSNIATVSINIYTINNLTITSRKEFYEIVIRVDNILTAIKNGYVDSSDASHFSSNFDDEDILNLYYNNSFTSGDYIVNKKDKNFGCTSESISIYELSMIDENATISLTDQNDISIKEINYKYYDESGSKYVITTKNLYVLMLNGVASYWEERDDSNSTVVSIGSDGFSTSEIGIFINNKKSLNQNNSEYEDKTISSSQKIFSEMSDEEKKERQTAFLSGAERTFMISAAGEEGSDYKCNNILSVLKNGVLYMGGEITDYYGKKLDISSLQYMPDEVRIINPNILMTTSGQIWCDWEEFYYAKKNEDGSLGYTTFSLKTFMDKIENWIEELKGSLSNLGSGSGSSSSSSGYGISGYYIDENDVDSGIKTD